MRSFGETLEGVLLLLIGLPSLLVLLQPLWIELARRKAQRRARRKAAWNPSVSLVVPLAGEEDHAAENLRSGLEQDVPGGFRVIFVAEDDRDPAVGLARAAAARHPGVEMTFVVSGASRGRIAKMHNLRAALPFCASDVVVFADSDVRLEGRGDLQAFVQPLADAGVGLVTAAPLYRAPSTVGGYLLATMINADLWAYFALLYLGGTMNVANGALLATRRAWLREIGDLEDLQQQILNDTALARRIRRAGRQVVLSPRPVTIPTPALTLRAWWGQVMRWHVAMRAVLPRAEYALYGYHRSPLLLGLLAFCLFGSAPHRALFLLIPAGCRLLSGALLSLRWLREPRAAPQVPLAVVTDLLSPAIWLLAWLERTVRWRGHDYRIGKGGAAREVSRA